MPAATAVDLETPCVLVPALRGLKSLASLQEWSLDCHESEDCYFWSLSSLNLCLSKASINLLKHHRPYILTLHSHYYILIIIQVHSHSHYILIIITFSSSLHSHHHYILITIIFSSPLHSHHYILISSYILLNISHMFYLPDDGQGLKLGLKLELCLPVFGMQILIVRSRQD